MFCKNCGSQVNDGAAFCPSCGTKIEGIPGQQAQQPYAQPQASPMDSVRKAVSGVDLMSIISLCVGAVGALLGLIALIKGIRSMTTGGLVNSIVSAFSGGSGAAGKIVLAAFAIAFSIAGLILSKRQIARTGENTFTKIGRICGLVGIILGAAGLVFSIIGAVRSRSVNSYMNDLSGLFSDLF